jgi:RNA polymerase sigma-70 factor (ECF subfamily)
MIDRSDTDLIALARAGDKVAFGQLIERHQPMVRRIATKMVRNEYLAQELTQETLLQAYLSLDQLRDDGRFQSWLYGITLNVCKSYLRLQKVNLLSWESLMGGTRVDPAILSRSAPDPHIWSSNSASCIASSWTQSIPFHPGIGLRPCSFISTN